MRTAALVGIMVISAVAAGAQASRQAGTKPTEQGRASMAAEITKVADDYVKATLAGDAKAIAALYTEDAVEMPPNQPLIKGRAAIEQYYQKLFGAGLKMANFSLTHIESRAIGDTGYDVGTYQQSLTPAGGSAARSESGKYFVLLKRTGGAWKVAYAIYNDDRPHDATR